MLTIRRNKFFGYDLFLLISLILTILALAILIPVFNGKAGETGYPQKWKVILFYTKIFRVRPTSIWSPTSLQSCPVPWCIISDDKGLLHNSDAVIFHGRDMPSVLPTERSTNQRWVYFVQENPHYTSPEPSKYNGVFNWTMTYKRSSDVWVPYGSYRTILDTSLSVNLADRNFSAEKTRLVAWASSHCSSPAFLREQYVEQLQLYIPVDIFGKCNPNASPCPRGSKQCNALLRTYKFYLAFENGFCEDYITEKYWEQALDHDLVPVVMGGADYSKLVIPESFINVLDFSSVENLASYLKALDRNSTAYNEYFHWKKKYATEPTAVLCKLCGMLHNESLPSKVHWDLGSFWGIKENCMRHSNTINDQT